ncbi:MAG: arginine--tRNA ligase [Parcubacteria group bacterium]|nr:arginine--tRNA ligase [Parcubacteria group bacterium]|tara:strand:+ start:6000 stop:7775 length:1776 start_codon:yes stop_codon:yes gene_type:complete
MDNKIQNFSLAEQQLRQEIVKLIKKVLGANFKEELIPIEYPPEAKMGDFTVPCFLLSKNLKKKPVAVASQLAEAMKPTSLITKIEYSGPYLNFFVRREEYNKLVLTEIAKQKSKYGSSKIGKGKKIMVEYFSPNTNKPLTIGHVRNICLGNSVAKLLNFTGHQVIESTLYNDRGIAIAKTILGYQKWGQGKTPKQAGKKPDHFVGDFYVKTAKLEKTDPNLAKEAKRVLQAWEDDKKEVRKTWEKLMTWVLDGFSQTLKKLGIKHFDEEYYESHYYREGKKIVEQGLKKGIFIQDKEGVIYASLEKHGLPNKILLRPDDTSLYVTQDLHLAYLKDKNKLDNSIYVVGSEQDLYFQQLFKILELLGFKNANKYNHLSYGMIRLPSGKIKSREGLVEGTVADDLINQLERLSKTEIKKRSSGSASGGKGLSEKELNKRAEKISLAALKFYILLVNPKTTMVFNPKESLTFNGRTGPYLQYVYARVNSIFVKAKAKPTTKVDFSTLSEEIEFELVKQLAKFPNIISTAVVNYDPSELANYLYDLAKAFSLFYEKLPIIKAEPKVKKARLLLIDDVKIVLAQGLELLGIETPDKM